jgi:non-lysosomal glucosylceramidase
MTNKDARDSKKKCCCGPTCNGKIERRDFLRLVVLSTIAGLAPAVPIMDGPFESCDFDKIVPADKKLDPAWVKSLFARGTPTIYRGAELVTIGMPVGGLCVGQLYLGGDGKLWHWDIFNRQIDSGGSGPHYAAPLKPTSPLVQGFGIRTTVDGTSHFRQLGGSPRCIRGPP